MTKTPYRSPKPNCSNHHTDDAIHRLIDLLAYQAVREDLSARHDARETASGSAQKDIADDQA